MQLKASAFSILRFMSVTMNLFVQKTYIFSADINGIKIFQSKLREREMNLNLICLLLPLLFSISVNLFGCSMSIGSNMESKLVSIEEQPKIEALFNNLPLHKNPLRFDTSQFGVKSDSSKTVMQAKKKYPAFIWNARMHSVRKSQYYSPDPSAVFHSVQYYYQGIENAKVMAYKGLLAEGIINLNKENDFVGQKVIISYIPSSKEGKYRCTNPHSTGFLSSIIPTLNETDHSQSYWSCEVTIDLELLIGTPKQF